MIDAVNILPTLQAIETLATLTLAPDHRSLLLDTTALTPLQTDKTTP